jgi:hypothetical protein
MEVKITKKEALKIANRIGQKFGIYGYGHFDISLDQYANILMIAFNENRNVDEKIKAYYDEINLMS